MSKQMAKYRRNKFNIIGVGHSALVEVTSHPYAGKSEPFVRTSKVISHDPESGRFETLNTIYEAENEQAENIA